MNSRAHDRMIRAMFQRYSFSLGFPIKQVGWQDDNYGEIHEDLGKSMIFIPRTSGHVFQDPL
jgi:hypothetical protein